MTASAQLGNRLGSARPGYQAGLGSRPAPPAPVPPAPAPPMVPMAAHPSAPRAHRVVKLLAAVTMTLAVVAGLSWLGQRTAPAVPERTSIIRVGAGETIWDVAVRVAPRSGQRAVVDRIRQLNGLAGGEVVPDQQLQVPDGR
jgi:LysM domain